jgi:hypothetical protein
MVDKMAKIVDKDEEKYHNWSMLQIPSTNEKIVDRFENYAKAFTKLSELHINPIGEVDEIVRDAFFQRYKSKTSMVNGVCTK